MTWFDDILNGIWDVTFGSDIEALQGIYDFLLELPNNLITLLLSLLYIVMYPFIVLITVVHLIFAEFWLHTIQLFNLPLDLINSSVEVVTIVNLPLPPVQLWLLFLILSTRVLFIIVRWIWSLIP